MNLLISLTAIFAVLSSVTCDLTINLNSENFTTSIGQENYFVLFVADERVIDFVKTFWARVSDLYNSDTSNLIKIAKVDCSQSQSLCDSENITELLSLKFYPKVNTKYNPEAMIYFLSSAVKNALKKIRKGTPEEPILELTPDDFKSQVDVGYTFVKFELKECSHCKELTPNWTELARHFLDDPKVTIASISCGKYFSYCATQRATAFPTLILYKDGEVLFYDYTEDYSVEGLIDCVDSHVAGGEILVEWFAKEKQKKKIRRAERKAEKKRKAEEAARLAAPVRA